MGNVGVGVLFASLEELVEVEVEGVGGPSIRGTRVAETGGHIVKARWNICAVVVSKLPPVGRANVVAVVVFITVQQPDPGEAAGGDSVVEVVAGQAVDVVNGSQPVSTIVGVIIAVQVLVPGAGLLRVDPWLLFGLVQVPGEDTAHQADC